MVYIYILQLESNKYYIGKTNIPKYRIYDHFNFKGSLWTKKYKPLKVINLLKNCDDYDEDKWTLIYMKKNGINNVRGGSFCEFNLSNEKVKFIREMLYSANNKCYICGEDGHFSKTCLENYEYYMNIEKEIFKKNNMCYICLRYGHLGNNCRLPC